MGRFDSFVALKNFLEGKLDRYELRGIDKRINQVSPKKDLGSSMIYYDMGSDEDLFKLVGLSEEDIWTYRSVSSIYGGDIYSEELSHEDFNSGYGIWDSLDEDNFDKLKMISQYIMKEPFEVDNDFLGRFAKTLYKVFPKETLSMIRDFAYERDGAMRSSAEEIVKKDIQDYFDDSNITYNGNGVISFTVKTLYNKYLEMATPHYSIYKVLGKLFEENPTDMGDWNNAAWESDWSVNFDKESFNRSVERELDSIIEKLEDDEETAKKFVEMISRVSAKHPQGHWKNLPKDTTKTVDYQVRGFDYPTQTIIVKLRKDLKQKEFKMTEDNFNNLLYQPELFKIGELHEF